MAIKNIPSYESATPLSKKLYIEKILNLFLILLIICLVAFNYKVFSQNTPFEPGSKRTVMLLNLDLVALLIFSVLAARRLIQFRSRHLPEGAGLRLHARLVKWFGFLLVTPAIIITIFSTVFFNLGIESWFNTRVKAALKNSTEVAEAYLEEHKKVISADVNFMARELAEELHTLMANPDLFNHVVNRQAELRSLSEAIVFTSLPEILARSALTFSLEFQRLSSLPLEQAQENVVIFQNEAKDMVRALVRIDPSVDAYLLVGRFVDPQVLNRIEQTATAVSEYSHLESLRSEFEIKFILIFIIVSLLLLFLVIWIGLAFANRLARPISNLIEAAERIRKGDLSTRVLEESNTDEISVLSRAFNRMTTQLESQREDLVEANKQIDRRRHFIETVLSGVTAGVIGLDENKKINVANKSAADLLSLNLDSMKGQYINVLAPEIAGLIEQADTEKKPTPSQVEIERKGAQQILVIQVAIEKDETDVEGYVITFDDVTELLNAQRKAAWADVARRLAHEIKNPLTPIQLSAERLKSRYLNQIKDDDGKTFQKYVDTIIRQVAYIGDMITEFSEFARMPSPILHIENLTDLAEQAVFLQRAAHPEISLELVSERDPLWCECDASQLTRVLTNLIQNAINSIENKRKHDRELAGKILVTIHVNTDKVILTVDDNGEGFPITGREQLTDPYVTFKEKGTGLGLAIVKRSIEDHGGNLSLEDAPLGGARVKLSLPLSTTKPTPRSQALLESKKSGQSPLLTLNR